jgi:hypothetical protein
MPIEKARQPNIFRFSALSIFLHIQTIRGFINKSMDKKRKKKK